MAAADITKTGMIPAFRTSAATVLDLAESG
jgi:hypothetical protein